MPAMDFLAALAARHAVGCWLFLRALGLIHVVAFVSMLVEVEGLVGSRGILPARSLLEAWGSEGWRRFLMLPTLCWLACSDRFLKGLCLAGILAGGLIAFGIATLPALVVAWIAYLSLMHACGVFLG